MAKSPDTFRFHRRVVATIAAFLGIIIWGPTTRCLCGRPHFSIEHLVAMMIVVAWGLFALATYRNRRERIVGWMAFAVASLAWFIEWSSNLIHLFCTRDILVIKQWFGL